MKKGKQSILMLLTNAFNPDPRVHQEARSLVNAGYNVTILCWDRDYTAPKQEVIDGIKLERIYVHSTHGRGSSQMAFLAIFWLKAFKKARRLSYGIIHCHDFDTLPLGFALSRLKNAKLVYDSHESYIDMLVNIPTWLKIGIFKFENFFIRRIDMLITVGDILKNYFIKRGAANACVVGNWKDPAEFLFSENLLSEEKTNFGITNGQKIISFVANLGIERQIPQLIEVVKKNSDVFLLIGGKGACQEIAAKASQNFPNIHYLGYVQPQKIPFYTALSDIVYYGFDPMNPNSRFSAPNKLFEALAAGKAIITGDFGEIGRITRESGCGIVIDNYEGENVAKAISALEGEFLETCKAKSRKASVEKYNWQNAKIILLKKYSTLSNRI